MTDQYHLELEQTIKKLKEQVLELESENLYLRLIAGELRDSCRDLQDQLEALQQNSATPPTPKMGFIY